MTATASQLRALTILAAHGPLRPREFAQSMWPRSPGWKSSARCGAHGSHRGGGMYLAAGGFLGKLAKRGWVRRDYRFMHGSAIDDGYRLTDLGRQVLHDAGDLPLSE